MERRKVLNILKILPALLSPPDFDDEERNELINFYYELMNPNYSRDIFVNNFSEIEII